MNTNHRLMMETRAAKMLRDFLLSITDDETAVRDTIDAETNLHDTIHNAFLASQEDDVLLTGLEAAIAVMKSRQERLERRIEKRREAILAAMQAGEISKLVFPEATISVRAKGPILVITDESKIPEKYWEPQPPKLQRGDVKADLADGHIVDGASLSNGGVSLTIRIA